MVHSYKSEIISRTIQGERNGARARVATGEQEGEVHKYGEGETGMETVPDESWEDVSVYSF